MEDYKTLYEQRLERAKEEIKKCGDNKGRIRMIENIFPELKESEDERIGEEIIAYMRYERKSTEEEIENRFIPWLEKQCEQKQDVNYPKFNFDDVLALQCCMGTIKKIQEDKELYEQLQSLHDRIHDAYWLEKQGEQNLTDKVEQKSAWSEEDEEMFKSLKTLLNDASCYSCTEGVDKILSWLKSLKERMKGE